MEAEISKLAAVASRLREVIRDIVRRRVSAGQVLSWQLMFEIEEEALRLLNADPALEASYVRLMAAPDALPRPNGDGPVGMHDLGGMRTTLWMIQEAYYHGH